jgi:prepilin-type N-terminal cleavage/methylation domain-containing protein
MLKRYNGFTMVELVIVIAVLAVLVTLGAIIYRGITDSAKDSAIKADISTIGDAVEMAEVKMGTSMAVDEETGVTLSDQRGVVDVESLIFSGKSFYTISPEVSVYLKRTTKPIDDFLVDTDKNIYYKGVYSSQAFKKWSKVFSWSSRDSHGESIAITNDGGYIVAGRLRNATNDDAWVAKIDANGTKVWDKVFNGTANADDAVFAIAKTNDNGYILSGTTNYVSANETGGDGWIIKIDANGTKVWEKIFNGTTSNYDEACSVIQTSDKGYIITGETNYDPNVDTSGDLWIIKVDENGNELWKYAYDGPDAGNYEDWGNEIIQTADGGYAVIGGTCNATSGKVWLLRVNQNGTKVGENVFGGASGAYDEGYSIIQTNDYGYAITGLKDSATYTDVWAIKTKADGALEWQYTFNGTSSRNDCGNKIIQTIDGGYTIVGVTRSATGGTRDNVWLIKLDASGQKVWDKAMYHTINKASVGHAIKQTNDNGYIISSCIYLTNGCTWLIKTDAKGNYE